MRSVQKQLHDKNVRPDAPACVRVARTDARLVCAGTRAVEPGGPGRSRPTAAARNREPRVGVRRSAASSPRHIRRLHTLSGSRAGHAAVPDASGRTESLLRLFATGQQGKAVPRRVAEPCKRATAWRYPLKPPPSVTPECVRSDRAWRCAELSWRAELARGRACECCGPQRTGRDGTTHGIPAVRSIGHRQCLARSDTSQRLVEFASAQFRWWST